MKDYSVLEKIRKSADSCEIPESLKPENLDLEKKGNLRNIYSRGPWKKAAAAAAVLALAVLAGFLTVNFKGNQGEQLSASFETAKKMEETAGSAGKRKEHRRWRNFTYRQRITMRSVKSCRTA